ncbi:Sphingosine N-acyltransferase lag1 [Tilletia horrida]|uniref:Sphingosine N-acyltransferase lag1 n=1 Tax=Tilletia horrida TaxID=155126 RepID=A0AAN6JKH0_9BASI|nr:Sphingosine N-acyltransferase lag1 [Tilletia horrida]
MDVLERLRQTPATKDIKTDTVFILAAAVWWTLLREVAVRLFLRPIAAKYVVSVSPDEVASAKAAPNSAAGAHPNGNGNGNGASNGANHASGAGKGTVISKRERRRQEHLQRRNEVRFSEQGWSVLYYSCSFLVGLYISVHQPWWPFNLKEFWTDYPEMTVDALLKYYYLAQTGFYVHQIFVLFSEARRKDHWQMFSHHIITVGLQAASFATHYHRVGVAIMLLLDPCDILLSAAKMLRYAGFQTVCDIFFGLFLVTWLMFRHILFNVVLHSAIVDVLMNPKADPKTGGYSTPVVTWTLIVMLAILQCILLIWFVMIVKVAYRVITGSGAADTRSDDEDDEELDLTEDTEEDGPVNGRPGGQQLEAAHSSSISAPTTRQRTSKA